MQAAIAAGDTVTGATTFLIERDLDSGPVYGVVTEADPPDDTAGELLQRLSLSGAALLESTLDGIADGTLVPVPQPAGRGEHRTEDHGRRGPGALGAARAGGRTAHPRGHADTRRLDDDRRRPAEDRPGHVGRLRRVRWSRGSCG